MITKYNALSWIESWIGKQKSYYNEHYGEIERISYKFPHCSCRKCISEIDREK